MKLKEFERLLKEAKVTYRLSENSEVIIRGKCPVIILDGKRAIAINLDLGTVYEVKT